MRMDIWLVPEALLGSSISGHYVWYYRGKSAKSPLFCPKCHYSDFDSEEVKEYSGMAGCDMPDKGMPGMWDTC